MTTQQGDYIEFNGEYYLLGDYCFPLEGYLEAAGIKDMTATISDWKGTLEYSFQTDCRRGYIALWSVQNGTLYLRDVRSPSLLESYKPAVFTGSSSDIAATWFSGSLLLVGCFDDNNQIINQTPPDISNVSPMRFDAKGELYDGEDERETHLMTAWEMNIQEGNVKSITELNKQPYTV